MKSDIRCGHLPAAAYEDRDRPDDTPSKPDDDDYRPCLCLGYHLEQHSSDHLWCPVCIATPRMGLCLRLFSKALHESQQPP